MLGIRLDSLNVNCDNQYDFRKKQKKKRHSLGNLI